MTFFTPLTNLYLPCTETQTLDTWVSFSLTKMFQFEDFFLAEKGEPT